MTITLEDSAGRVLAKITPGEGQKVFLCGSRERVRIEAREHEDGLLKIHIWPRPPLHLLFGRVRPEKG